MGYPWNWRHYFLLKYRNLEQLLKIQSFNNVQRQFMRMTFVLAASPSELAVDGLSRFGVRIGQVLNQRHNGSL